jgi:hypothetical protein
MTGQMWGRGATGLISASAFPDEGLSLLFALVVVVLLIVTVYLLVKIDKSTEGAPDAIVKKLSGGTVAKNLEDIGSASKDAATRVQALDDSLRTSEALGRWRDVLLTVLGTVIGLVGGFGAPWVAEGGGWPSGGQVVRAAAIVLLAALTAFLFGKFGVPLVEKCIGRKARKREARDGGGVTGAS